MSLRAICLGCDRPRAYYEVIFKEGSGEPINLCPDCHKGIATDYEEWNAESSRRAIEEEEEAQ